MQAAINSVASPVQRFVRTLLAIGSIAALPSVNSIAQIAKITRARSVRTWDRRSRRTGASGSLERGGLTRASGSSGKIAPKASAAVRKNTARFDR